MLKFDSNHASVKEDLRKKKGKEILKRIVAAGLIITTLFSFSGCYKEIPCDVQYDHAHYYVSDDYMGRYIISEKSSVSGLERSDNYIAITLEDAEFLKFINQKDLFKIDDNKAAIEKITESHEDFKEYRYRYYYNLPIPRTYTNGKQTYTTYSFIPMVGHSWTKNANKHNLTGDERTCHYVYYGYKIIQNDKGEYELLKSEAVDNIEDLPEGYDYIKEEFYKVVNLYNKDEELSYEDGPEESKKIISEEEYNSSKSK